MLDIWTGERPNVVAWYRRIQARPSYKVEVSDWMKPEELPEIHNAGTRNKARIAEFRTIIWRTISARRSISGMIGWPCGRSQLLRPSSDVE